MAGNNTGDSRLLLNAANKAGEIALRYFNANNEVWYKHGNSPVSEADFQVDKFLREFFQNQRPGHAWLSEETEDDETRLAKEKVIIVDPIDGTRGFINGRPEWCISIAMIENSEPVAAILHCPALGQTFSASRGGGLTLTGIEKKLRPANNRLLATGSKKLNQTMRELPDAGLNVMEFVPSLAYRLALVAAGSVDVALAHSGSSEWDIAAADLILSEAGSKVTDANGNRMSYNKQRVGMPALVAANGHMHDEVLELVNSAGILH